jgi:hypothetical protein
MGDGFSLVIDIITTVLLVVGTLVIVSAWRSGLNGKWLYMYLGFYALLWARILDQLLALIAVPLGWRDAVDGVLFALAAVNIVLLYRHRHDPDPDEV